MTWVVFNRPEDVATFGGPGWCEVIIQRQMRNDVCLIKPYDHIQKIGDSLGAPVAWPLSLVGNLTEASESYKKLNNVLDFDVRHDSIICSELGMICVNPSFGCKKREQLDGNECVFYILCLISVNCHYLCKSSFWL